MVRKSRIALATARTVFAVYVVFAATERLAVAATLHYEATMQAAAPELRRTVAERGCEVTEKGREAAEKGCGVATAAPVITAARWAILSQNTPISSSMGPLLLSSQKKQRPSDARLGVAGPYCC